MPRSLETRIVGYLKDIGIPTHVELIQENVEAINYSETILALRLLRGKGIVGTLNDGRWYLVQKKGENQNATEI